MSETERLVTADEFERFPKDERYRRELVEGRVIRMSPVNFDHGRIAARLCSLLYRHLERHGGGVVVNDVGFKLKSNPDTVRGPDVAFVRADRVPAPGRRGFVEGVPDAAFEVLSPDDRPSEIREKIEEYLERGVPLVVVVDPKKRRVSTFRPDNVARTLRGDDDVLDLRDVISGFRCRVREIFE